MYKLYKKYIYQAFDHTHLHTNAYARRYAHTIRFCSIRISKKLRAAKVILQCHKYYLEMVFCDLQMRQFHCAVEHSRLKAGYLIGS